MGNHTNDLLLTSELFDDGWYQGFMSLRHELSEQLDLPSLSELSLDLMRDAADATDRLILAHIEQDAERLADADPASPPVEIIWSI